MAPLYPIYLKLSGRRVVIAGGGTLALQKVESLESSGAAIEIVAPRVHPALWRRLRRGRLQVRERPWQPGDLDGAALVYAATDDAPLNHRIVALARARGILANAVDDPRHCDFYTPSIVRRGPFAFAISSDGGFPGATRALRQALEGWLPDGDTELLADLLALRERIRRRHPVPDMRRARLQALLQHFTQEYLADESDAARDHSHFPTAPAAPGAASEQAPLDRSRA